MKKAKNGYYDVIIQDSSDPYAWDESSGEKIDLPSKTLYSDEHFKTIARILGKDGIFSFQAEVCIFSLLVMASFCFVYVSCVFISFNHMLIYFLLL